MKKIKQKILIVLGCVVLSACSSDRKGPLSRKTMNFSSYEEAISSWNYMNSYQDEGQCKSFDFTIEEFGSSSKSYFLSGIDVSSRYSASSNLESVILSHRGFSITFSSTFYIWFTLKNNDIDISGSDFSWQIYEENNDGITVIHNDLGPKIKNYYYWGYFEKPNNCDTAYCFCDSKKNLALVVGFLKDETEHLFKKYKDDFEDKLLGAIYV